MMDTTFVHAIMCMRFEVTIFISTEIYMEILDEIVAFEYDLCEFNEVIVHFFIFIITFW